MANGDMSSTSPEAFMSRDAVRMHHVIDQISSSSDEFLRSR
jgi:hypothetical protein